MEVGGNWPWDSFWILNRHGNFSKFINRLLWYQSNMCHDIMIQMVQFCNDITTSDASSYSKSQLLYCMMMSWCICPHSPLSQSTLLTPMYNLLIKEYTFIVSLSCIIKNKTKQKNPHSACWISCICLLAGEYISYSHFYGDDTKVFILHINLEVWFPHIPFLTCWGTIQCSLSVQNVKILAASVWP